MEQRFIAVISFIVDIIDRNVYMEMRDTRVDLYYITKWLQIMFNGTCPVQAWVTLYLINVNDTMQYDWYTIKTNNSHTHAHTGTLTHIIPQSQKK